MKSRPILFNAKMVRAILDGRKTQTRRVIKMNQAISWMFDGRFSDEYISCSGNISLIDQCPYGKKGDFLWAREAFRAVNEYGGDEWSTYAYPKYKDGQLGPIAALQEEYFYKKNKWQPSIFMPRWASRITLKIVDIRVEKIRDISIDDCVAEGIPQYTFARGVLSDDPPDQRWKFIELWDSINAKRGYGWDENPWVWVVEFERVEE